MRIFYFLTLMFLTACGFTPLYGDHKNPDAINSLLENVAINTIPDQEGQYLRNLLIDRFYRTSRPQNPAFALTIAPIVESRIDLDETEQSDTTRQQLRLVSHLTLTRLDTNEVILKRPLRSITSYNVLSSEYTTRVSRTDVRNNALNDLARQIETITSLYLRTSAAENTQ